MPKKTASCKLTLDSFSSQVYLPHVRMQKRSWQLDARIIRTQLSPAFGHCPMLAISPCAIESWRNALLASGIAPASINRFLAVLKSIFRLACKNGLLPPGESPCSQIRNLRAHNERNRFLSASEACSLMRYLRQCPEREALVLQLLLLTGARKSEILQARWECLDLPNQILTVPISKSGKPRYIILSRAALDLVLAIPGRTGQGWLFPSSRGTGPMPDIYKYWNRIRTRLDLKDVRIHDLRHTFASFLINGGHSLYEVQHMLGHADPRTTMRYAHLTRQTLKKAAEEVSNVLVNSTQPAI